jgi:hypothetical protein
MSDEPRELRFAERGTVHGLPGGPMEVIVDDVTACGGECDYCGGAGLCRSVKFVRPIED